MRLTEPCRVTQRIVLVQNQTFVLCLTTNPDQTNPPCSESCTGADGERGPEAHAGAAQRDAAPQRRGGPALRGPRCARRELPVRHHLLQRHRRLHLHLRRQHANAGTCTYREGHRGSLAPRITGALQVRFRGGRKQSGGVSVAQAHAGTVHLDHNHTGWMQGASQASRTGGGLRYGAPRK